MSKITVEQAKPLIGGIVHVDRAHLMDDDVVGEVQQALEDRGVLVFPKFNLTDAEQIAFTDKLGARVHFTKTVPGSGNADEVYKITLDEDVNFQPEYVLGTYFWHIDGVTIDQPLPKATMLTARKLSETGGQTEFANTYAAYDALPEDMKRQIAGLKVQHDVVASLKPVHLDPGPEDFARWAALNARMVQPLVWTKKDGRKSLVLGSHADTIVDMPVADGRALIARLMEWCGQPHFRYTHEWQVGDMVIWDNCGTMHRVIPYPADSGRMMHRTTIAGTERVAA